MPSHPLLSQQPFAALTSHPLPKTGGKKKITLPRGCPLGQRLSSQIQRETRKTLQEPKKQKKPKTQNPKSQGFVQEHSLLWPQPSSHHLQRGPSCGVVQRLTMQIKLGLPQKC